MRTTIDKAGRVVIPAAARERIHLEPGTELEVRIEDYTVRLVPRISPPEIVRRGQRWVVRATAPPGPGEEPFDAAEAVRQERERLPSWTGHSSTPASSSQD